MTVTELIKQSFAYNLRTELDSLEILRYVNQEYTAEHGHKPRDIWRVIRLLVKHGILNSLGNLRYELSERN